MNDVASSKLIVEASPLISFLKIGRFDLLKIFDKTLVCTDFVRLEIINQKQELDSLLEQSLIEEILIDRPSQLQEIENLYGQGLGRGESSSIILAIEINAPLLIDDKKARKLAARRGIALTSTVETMVRNIKQNNISLQQADDIIGLWHSMGEFPVKVKSFRELL